MLSQIKTLLGLSDTSQDEKLESIISLTSARLASLLGTDGVPKEMEYIAVEASIRRFNRIGSEGMKSHDVEGESVAYRDDDFEGFMADIEAYRSRNQNPSPLRRIKFY